MKKFNCRLSVLAFCLAVPLSSQASEIFDLSSMIGDVNLNQAGPELVVPSMTYASQGLEFSFMVLRPEIGTISAKSHYKTLPKSMNKPPLSCTSPTWRDGDEKWKFLRFEKFMVAGATLITECGNQSADRQETYASYIYIIDVSSSGKVPVLLSYPGKDIIGLNLTDNLNAAGSRSDLMITLMDQATKPGMLSVLVRDFISGGVYSTTTSQAITEPVVVVD